MRWSEDAIKSVLDEHFPDSEYVLVGDVKELNKFGLPMLLVLDCRQTPEPTE